MAGAGVEQVALIGNPASGRGRGAAALERVLARLQGAGVEPRLLETERAAHAVELAAEVAAGFTKRVLVLGGDGTVRDVVEGLERGGALGRVVLGILPGGTGNDLGRTLGLPRDLDEAVDVALNGTPRPLDVWRWNETPFINVAGVGLDAAVADVANRRFRWLHGTPAYLAAFCVALPRFRPFPLELRWSGGGWSGKAWLAAFGNARCYGGGMQITPAAEPDDGLLDVVVIEGLPVPELLREFPGIFAGRHVRHPRVRSFRVESVHVEAPPQPATIDGELIGSTPAHVIRCAERLKVAVPGGGSEERHRCRAPG